MKCCEGKRPYGWSQHRDEGNTKLILKIWEGKKCNSLPKHIDQGYANYSLMFDELSDYFLLGLHDFREWTDTILSVGQLPQLRIEFLMFNNFLGVRRWEDLWWYPDKNTKKQNAKSGLLVAMTPHLHDKYRQNSQGFRDSNIGI